MAKKLSARFNTNNRQDNGDGTWDLQINIPPGNGLVDDIVVGSIVVTDQGSQTYYRWIVTALDTDGPIAGTTRWIRIDGDDEGTSPTPSWNDGLIMAPVRTGSRVGWVTYPEEFAMSPALTAYAKNANDYVTDEDKLDTDSTEATGPREPTTHASSHDTTGADALDITSIGGVAEGDVRLSDDRNPLSHSGNHTTGGSDPLTPADIGAATSSHNHDATYYRENEHINTSAGVADAGKPIVLDATGKIAASMLITQTTTAANVTTNVAGFNNLLQSSDTNIQLALDRLDDHTHAATTSHINDSTIHFAATAISHTVLQNRGTTTHAALDSHVGDASIHFAETAINHNNITNRGTNAHSTIDTHLGNSALHFSVGSINHASITNLDYASAGHTGFAQDSDARFPTSDQKAALAGTSGTPSTSNRYVTNGDTRMTNARVPSAHAASHYTAGGDALTPANIGAEPANANIQSHVTSTSNPHSTTATQVGAIPTTQKATANGVATLDAGSKIPTAQLPDSVVGSVIYQGTWNANTNVPAIPVAAAGNKGRYYKVSVAGTTNIDGNNDWAIGDWIISNGTTWDQVNNTDSVSSVNGATGAVSGLEVVSNRVDSMNDSTTNYATTNAIKTYVDTEISTHDHTGTYYATTEFVNTSTGPSDAGKPIVLDATGKIASSMIQAAGATTADNVSLVTTAFDGILSDSESDVQAAMDAIDDHVHATYAESSDTRFPSQDENDALAGTSGSPSNTNRYVTNDDARNTNARTPSAHASSHDTTGSDPITPADIDAVDTTTFGVLDSAVSSHTGTSNIHFTVASIDHSAMDATTLAYAASGHTGFAASADSRFPTSAQKAALAGSTGSPDATNVYVTTTDTRMTNARTPSAHASSHDTTGTDAISPAGIGAVDTTDLGIASGVATLDASAQLTASQFPNEYAGALRDKGTWDASSNNPTLVAADSTNSGWFYRVSIAGTTEIDGINDWEVGDWVVSNGTTWTKADNSDSVTSVNGQSGVVTGLESTSNKVGTVSASATNYPTTNAIIAYAFDKTEFINVTSGVADAGKPIVLDATGKIDSSMYSAGATTGSTVSLTTTNFDGILDTTDNNVQLALNKIDDHLHASYATTTALGNHANDTTIHYFISDISHTDISDIGTNTHAQIDTHIGDTTNPHSVTAAQVGNSTAQWNANQIQGKPVDSTGLVDGYVISYDSTGDKFEFVAQTGSGGGVSVYTNNSCKIVASDTGVTFTLDTTSSPQVATFSIPAGVTLLSASFSYPSNGNEIEVVCCPGNSSESTFDWPDVRVWNNGASPRTIETFAYRKSASEHDRIYWVGSSNGTTYQVKLQSSYTGDGT